MRSVFAGPGAEGVETLSFEEGEKTLVYAQRFDDSEFVEGGRHPGLRVGEYLGFPGDSAGLPDSWPETLMKLWNELDMPPLANRGLKYLSTGELRKVLLFHALARKPSLLVCDEILEGLDTRARRELGLLFAALREAESSDNGTSLLFLCDREEQIPEIATHLLRMEGGRVLSAGPFAKPPCDRKDREEVPAPEAGGPDGPEIGKRRNPPAVAVLKGVHVAWEDKTIFEDFDFTLREGEHCLVRGPNGCGKSTLVKLLTGEHPQVWANDVEICGIKRGGGESARDVLSLTGLVSYDLHRAFLRLGDIPIEEVVLSGFYSTVGLYEPTGEEEVRAARETMVLCGLEEYGHEKFSGLSWGLQRLALAARAFVRRPRLFILDEPCHGLDSGHRRLFLDLVDGLAAESARTGPPCTIIHVTHDPAERLECTRAELVFHPAGRDTRGQPRYRTEFTRKG
jgi:molybdate transport system ATP-binding protein